jgi:hypothetical protein
MNSSDPRIKYVKDCICGNSIEIFAAVGKPFNQMCGRCGKWLKGVVEVKEAKCAKRP